MYRRSIINFLESDPIFFTTKILKQLWKQDRYSYRKNPRPDYGMMLLIRGEVKLVSRDGVLVAKAGDIVFLPKHSNYEAVFEKEAEDYLVNFDAKENDLLLSVPVCLLRDAPLSIIEGFASLLDERLSENQSFLRLNGLFYLLLDRILINAFAETSASHKTIQKAKSFCATQVN